MITPSLTFVAAANAVRLTGATPVFCDIGGPDDLNLDTADLESAITEHTKAVLVLHYGGFPCDMDTVLEIAARHRIAVVEDAAHGLGAQIGDRSCGTLGAVGCFSFFANKNLPIGEGGMVVTDDPELANRLKLLRSHGMTTLTWDRHRGHASSYDVLTVGFNYRLDEIRAAMALVQLERLPALTRQRGTLADRYVERLHGVAGIVVPFAGADRAAAAHHLAVVVLPEHTDREQVRSALGQCRRADKRPLSPGSSLHRLPGPVDAGAPEHRIGRRPASDLAAVPHAQRRAPRARRRVPAGGRRRRDTGSAKQPADRRRGSPEPGLLPGAAEHDAAVVAAEAHGVRERDLQLDGTRLVGHVVEVALRIGCAVVDRRRQHAVVQRQRAHHRLDRARRPRSSGR